MAATRPDVMGDFDAWAQVAASMIKRSPEERLDILRHHDLEQIWPDADAKWSTRMTDGIIADDMTLADRYGRLCAAELERRQSDAAAPRPDLADRLAAGPTVPVAPSIGQNSTLSAQPQPQPHNVRVVGHATPDAQRGHADVALPFKGGPARAPTPHNPADASLPPGQSGTVAASGGVLAGQTGAANRFDGGAPRLTIQQYAKLCARLAEHPQHESIIYADYGIADRAAHAQLDAEWKQRLAAEPENKKLFDMLYPYLRTQIRTGAS